MWIKILGAFFMIFAISRVVVRLRDASLNKRELIFWLFIFSGVLVIVLYPDLTSVMANFVGIHRGADLIVYGLIALLLFLVFRTFILIENLEYRITLIIREIAIAQYDGGLNPKVDLDKHLEITKESYQ